MYVYCVYTVFVLCVSVFLLSLCNWFMSFMNSLLSFKCITKLFVNLLPMYIFSLWLPLSNKLLIIIIIIITHTHTHNHLLLIVC